MNTITPVAKIESLNVAYEGIPRWDIGKPQPEFACLPVRGRVLDIGCGTGEATLLFAQRGHEVCGIDLATAALAKARDKARRRGLNHVPFVQVDALDVPPSIGTFDTIIDAGLFHVLTDQERPLYARSLQSLLRPHGRVFILCFSDREPGAWGPRRVSEHDIHDTFDERWIVDVRPARMEALVLMRFRDDGTEPPPTETRPIAAWLATLALRRNPDESA